jgi:hypothetical protein
MTTPTPRITAIRVFKFSRMAKVADLNKRDDQEQMMMMTLLMPLNKCN